LELPEHNQVLWAGEIEQHEGVSGRLVIRSQSDEELILTAIVRFNLVD